ncbi:MAG TPA: glycosyl hydrolase family 18 protein, partial [Phycisphaeraceae bacterium]
GGNQVVDTTTLYLDGITQLQQAQSATEQWDATSQTPFFTYNDGQSHQVWYENARSYRQKLKLALNEGLQGVGAWSLRYTDREAAPAFWPVYESLTSHVDAGDRWYTTSDTTVTRASTTVGDAVDLTVNNGSGLERIGANFDTLQLDDAGDRISLKFDMKRLTGGSISDSTGFRFGLYNNGGTPITADSTSGVLQNTTDDTGYFIELGVGAAGATASREGAESNGILAGPRTYNVALGSGSGAGFAGFNDTDLHEVTLLLTRLTNGIHLIIEVDGVAVIDVSDTTSGYVTDLNIVAFGIREIAYDYWLGNVRVNAYTVPNPEPASSMLLTAGMLVLATRPAGGLRRRSRHR